MKFIHSIFLIVIFNFCGVKAQQVFQLAPPILNYSSIFFKDEIKVSLQFAQAGTTIRYTLNGDEPNENSKSYFKPIIVKDNFTTIKAKVFGENFLASDAVEATFVKNGLPLQSVSFPQPHKNYAGSGEHTLIDNKGGQLNYSSNTWMGFNQDTVTIYINLEKRKKVKAVLFNVLQNHGAWIFFPQNVVAFTLKKAGKVSNKMGSLNFVPKENIDVNLTKPFVINFDKKIKTKQVVLKLFLLKQIPSWHAGAGQPSWIFIDEVKLY